MSQPKEVMYDFLSNYVTKGDVYTAKAIAEISATIIRKRKSLQMSQKDFATMMGVSQGMISKWESASYNFTVESIGQIAEKLGMTFDIVLKSENEYLNVPDQKYEYARHSKQNGWAVKKTLSFAA